MTHCKRLLEKWRKQEGIAIKEITKSKFGKGNKKRYDNAHRRANTAFKKVKRAGCL